MRPCHHSQNGWVRTRIRPEVNWSFWTHWTCPVLGLASKRARKEHPSREMEGVRDWFQHRSRGRLEEDLRTRSENGAWRNGDFSDFDAVVDRGTERDSEDILRLQRPWVRLNHRPIGKGVRTIYKKWNGVMAFVANRGPDFMGSRALRPCLNNWRTKKWMTAEHFINTCWSEPRCLVHQQKMVWKYCLSRRILLLVLWDFDLERCHAYRLFYTYFWFRPTDFPKENGWSKTWRVTHKWFLGSVCLFILSW
jgi:hypothetical protein